MKILIMSIGLEEHTQIKILEKKVKSIIVKFNSWISRQQFYSARPKHSTNNKWNPGQHLFSVSVDLTRRRYLLLNKSKGLIKDCESINYVFADIYCSYLMKFQNGVFKYFSSKNEPHFLINNWIIGGSHWKYIRVTAFRTALFGLSVLCF